jgi:hypothetical protein
VLHGQPHPRVLVIAGVLVACLVAAAVRMPTIVRDAVDAGTAGRQGTDERELAPADVMDVPNEMIARAEQVIPPDATYNVVLGPQFELTETQKAGIPVVLRYYLLPRHEVQGTEGADWVIAYGQSSESLGIRYRREVPLAEGVNALEVEH